VCEALYVDATRPLTAAVGRLCTAWAEPYKPDGVAEPASHHFWHGQPHPLVASALGCLKCSALQAPALGARAAHGLVISPQDDIARGSAGDRKIAECRLMRVRHTNVLHVLQDGVGGPLTFHGVLIIAISPCPPSMPIIYEFFSNSWRARYKRLISLISHQTPHGCR
jgi:hypothetical protein